MGVRFH
jgi:hypothetical protein